MSYYKDALTDSKYIMQIVYEIGASNKFDYMSWEHILELAEVIYDDYEYYDDGDIREYTKRKLNEIIELEEMLQ